MEKKETKNKYQKGRRKLEIIYQWDIVCYILKWKTIKNNMQTTKGRQRIESVMVTYYEACW